MQIPQGCVAGSCECVTVAVQRPAPVTIAGELTPGRALELQVGDRGRVLRAVGEERLFSGDQVAEVRLHRRDVRLRLRVRELRNRDRGQDADDDDDDQKFDEGKALAHFEHVDGSREGGEGKRPATARRALWQRADPTAPSMANRCITTTCQHSTAVDRPPCLLPFARYLAVC